MPWQSAGDSLAIFRASMGSVLSDLQSIREADLFEPDWSEDWDRFSSSCDDSINLFRIEHAGEYWPTKWHFEVARRASK